MKHYILTRSVFDPNDWKLEDNEKRLAISDAVTVQSIEKQTCQNFEWIVMAHPDDQLLAERTRVFSRAGATIVYYDTANKKTLGKSLDNSDLVAWRAYSTDTWNKYIDHSEPVITTRIDDDDGFAVDAIEKLQDRITSPDKKIYIFPFGYRVSDCKCELVQHNCNAWCSLVSPAGDISIVYSYGHTQAHKFADIEYLDNDPNWLWVRHDTTLSGHKTASSDIDLVANDPRFSNIDWDYVRSL